MKLKTSDFVRGALLGGFVFAFSFFVLNSDIGKVSAQGGSDCDQATDCTLLEGVAQSGTHDHSSEISHVVIKAGQNYFTFHGGASDDGCYKVSIDNTHLSWERYGSGPDCQEISHLQIWEEEGGEPELPTPPTPPSFPSCVDYLGITGDWVHSDSGFHHIPGQEATIEGSDDVYFLEGGNFLQCLCGLDGQGKQTTWWKIGDKGYTTEQIQFFLDNGWFAEDGRDWNLIHTGYLAKNSDYVCAEPTPTPTPTGTVTPTPTNTPTPTPTNGDEPDEPHCSGLSASPDHGSSPLTVVFTGSGFDPNGDILEYEFDFGDASGGQPQVWKQDESEASHRYENSGSYVATLKVKDQGGRWRDGNDDCKIIIEVDGEPRVLGGQTTTELPKTGAPALLGIGFAALGTVGRVMYRRFRLV